MDKKIGNGNLKPKTELKVFIYIGSEFGYLEEHILIIVKIWYGLHTYGLLWNKRFADCLHDVRVFQSK
jgi:hypothetical protein